MTDYRHEMVAMRDGVKLGTHIWTPEGEGPWPALLMRHPYGGVTSIPELERFAEQGYVVLRQDCRGRYTSEGEWSLPLASDADDGEDAVNWIAEQPWCNGKVGLIGASFGGMTQMQTASRQPAPLTAMVPYVPSLPYEFTYVAPGVSGLGVSVGWALNVAIESQNRANVVVNNPLVQRVLDDYAQQMELAQAMLTAMGTDNEAAATQQWVEVFERVNQGIAEILQQPLSDFVKAMEPICPWVRQWVENPLSTDECWRNMDYRADRSKISNMQAPMMMVVGWYDIFSQFNMRDVSALLSQPDGAQRHRVVVLPFEHGVASVLGGVPDPSEIKYDWTLTEDVMALGGHSPALNRPGMVTDWLAHWMKGEASDVLDTAPLQLYVMGENVMRGEHEWPLARTEWTNFYLHSGGNANTAGGDGALSTEVPASEAADNYSYDPANPVPSKGGNGLMINPTGAHDQREVEARDDVLVYSTPVLDQAVEVTGPVVLKLWATTSAVDTDFTAKLVDVYPDGRAINLCDGVTRLRYREDNPGLVTPGELQQVTIELFPTSNLFKEGHQIRLEVSSSNFPYLEPNPNTGKSLFLDESNEMIVAEQTVYHDVERPSHLILPIIPR